MTPAASNALADRAAARVGSVLRGRYRVDRLIGMGGMAAVFAGTHRNGHRVAIKILHDRGQLDPDVRSHFMREAYIANKIQHTGTIPVLDDDESEDGCLFLVMPLLNGQTVRARWESRGRRLLHAEVAAIASTVLGVLALAHAQGIVHRDVKPENLFVTSDGAVKV